MVRVFVGIGSNFEREKNIRSGIEKLQQRFGDLVISPVYESESIGFDGANFYNLAASFNTGFMPVQLVAILHEIETMCNRNRIGPRFSSRTLDLDLLMYGNHVSNDENIHLPREEITRYAFVLKPLADIAGDQKHPVNGRKIAELWDNFDNKGQKLWQVDINFEQG